MIVPKGKPVEGGILDLRHLVEPIPEVLATDAGPVRVVLPIQGVLLFL